MIENDERHLREDFQALRRDAAGRMPSFASTVLAARARRTASGGWVVAAAAVIVVAVAAVALVVPVPRRGVRDGRALRVDLTTVRWRAPTDFLLTLPGDELLRTVPRLGRRSLDRRML